MFDSPAQRPSPFAAACVAFLAICGLPATGQTAEAPGLDDLVLHAPVRRSGEIQALGRRAAWLGSETGSFEAWVYPLKVVRDLRLRFGFRDREFRAEELAAAVEVRPESTTVTYAHEAFTVRQVMVGGHDVPAAIMLLSVDASFPVSVWVEFHIEMEPMWPAALGGQYSWWDANLPGFVLGEGSGRNLALVASPVAGEPTIQPAHSLPDQPTRFRLELQPGAPAVPVVVAATATRLSAGEGRADEAGLRDVYAALVRDPDAPVQRARARYAEVDGTARVRTPYAELDAMLRWAKIRLEQGLVCNPHTGCGMVAGYAAAGAGYRPGFAWFFGGDAFYNSWALAASGNHATVRQSLEFLARYQRDDGKIMHELSQGAGYLDWFGDYPYGYYHAEGTPYFVGAVAEHARDTGDRAWVESMLPALRRAMAYCAAADGDGDGLMENTIAGLGAVEMGALREASVHQDIYLVSVWLDALEKLTWLAGWLDDDELLAQATDFYRRGRAALARTWLEAPGHYAFATLEDGATVDELTLWSVLPVSLLEIDDAAAARRAVAAVAGPAVTTDWGTRMLAATSPLYDPLIYNQGTVWPFLSGFAGLAAYAVGNHWYGEDIVYGLVRLGGDDMLAAWPEVLSGDRYQPMGPSVPNQLFSSSSLVTTVMEGMLGIQPDAAGGRLLLAPQLPDDWDAVRIEALPVGETTVDVTYEQTPQSLTVRLRAAGEVPPTVTVSPRLPPGTAELRLDGEPAPAPSATPTWERRADGWESRASFEWRGGVRFRPLREGEFRPGQPSRGLRVARVEHDPDSGCLLVDVAGRVGATYPIWTSAHAMPVQPVDLAGAPAAARLRLSTSAPQIVELVLEGPPDTYVGARLGLHPSAAACGQAAATPGR